MADPAALERCTVTGLERLAADDLVEAGHRVIDICKRQLIVEPRSAAILTNPPRLADDLFLVEAAVPDPGQTKAALAVWLAKILNSLSPNHAAEFAVTIINIATERCA
ncbi:hypothetical protein [Kribbella sp. NPDC055071]